MKRGLKQKLYFFLVMALVFFTGKAALAEPPWDWECDYQINGCVCDAAFREYIAVLPAEEEESLSCDDLCDDSEESWVYVKGVPFERLGIKLYDYVRISAHECIMDQIRACAVDETSVLPIFKGKEDPVSGDEDGSQGKYGQGRF